MYMKNKELKSISAENFTKTPLSPLSLRKYKGLAVFGQECPRSDLAICGPKTVAAVTSIQVFPSLRFRASAMTEILPSRPYHPMGRT
jgi:hypothetical protein